jgi:hypothetical protein
VTGNENPLAALDQANQLEEVVLAIGHAHSLHNEIIARNCGQNKTLLEAR